MSERPRIPESHRDLVQARGVAAFTTLEPTGYPQTTAVWFLAEGDEISTSIDKSRRKYTNLVRHPKATFFFIDPTNGFHTLEIRGDVTLTEDEDHTFFDRIFAAYGASTDGAPAGARVKVTVHPRRILTHG